jgi:hypothetical protein
MRAFRRSLAVPLLTAGALLIGLLPASAAGTPPYQHIGTVTEPNVSLNDGFSSFDISFVDNKRDEYLLADRAGTDRTGAFIHGRIVVVDADDGSLIGYVGTDQFAGTYNNPASGFAGCAELPRDPRNGPNGVLTDDDGFIWVGDGNKATSACSGPGGTFTSAESTIKVFDTSGAMVANIGNGGNRRADELAFGKVHGSARILISNPEEEKPNFPFATLLNADTRKILGKITYDAVPTASTPTTALPPVGHGWDSSLADTGGNGGLEQDVFDPETGNFFLNVPATTLNAGGEIDVISPEANSSGQGRVLKVIPLDGCNGSGLAISGDKLAVQCGGDIRVIDKDSGKLLAPPFTAGGGADEIWFDPADGNVYQGLIGIPPGAPGVGILDLRHLMYVGVVQVEPGLGTHSVAAGGRNNRIFLPMAEGSVAAHTAGNGGIGMFHKDDREPRGGDDDN